jgi:RNase P/RNase MRP subunit p29
VVPCGGFCAAFFLEEHVVSGVGVEGRVEVDEVNAGVRQLAAQDVKIVSKVESVFPIHYQRAYHKSA